MNTSTGPPQPVWCGRSERSGTSSGRAGIVRRAAVGKTTPRTSPPGFSRWILAALRHQKFFRLADLNHAIRELLERLNQRPFRKREGSRASVFAAVERNALRALPAEPFDMSQWSYARVNIDYHIAFDANLYSVPYTLVQERVEVRATPTTIEIFHKGQRVASHVRGHEREQVFTQREHRPKSHQAHLEWTPSRMVHWAEQIGPHTAKLFERILAEKPHPEMGYRSCLG